ncbi:MAG: Rab family GTPase [Candidatus Thorarchaeota archaeon]
MYKEKVKDVFKILVLGAPGVGKTTLINNYSDKPFQENTASKVGVNFFIKYEIIDGHKYTMQFWDFLDEEKFGSLHTLYYKGASAIFLIFDLSEPNTFDYIKKYLSKVRKEGQLTQCPTLLIGNKLDLVLSEDKIDREMYYEFVRQEGLLGYIETSMNNLESIIKEIPKIIQGNLKKNYQVKFLVNSNEFKEIKKFAKISHQKQSDFIRTAIWEKIKELKSPSSSQNSKKNNDSKERKLRMDELKKIRELLERLENLD